MRTHVANEKNHSKSRTNRRSLANENSRGQDETAMDTRSDQRATNKQTPDRQRMRPKSSKPGTRNASRNEIEHNSFSSEKDNNIFNKKLENDFEGSHRSGGDPYACKTNAFHENDQEDDDDDEEMQRPGVKGVFYNRTKTQGVVKDDEDDHVMVFSAKKSKRSPFKKRQTHA